MDYVILNDGTIAKNKGDYIRLFSLDLENEVLHSEDASSDDIEALNCLVRHKFDDGFFVVDSVRGLVRCKRNTDPKYFKGRRLSLVVLECEISEELFDTLFACCIGEGRVVFGPGGRIRYEN